MRQLHVIVLFFLMCLSFSLAMAKTTADANLVAIGQGISSPSSTSTLNYSSGFTSENPVGVIYQNGARLSVQHDRNDDSDAPTGLGAELGYGSGEWGAAVGHYKRDCSGCDGQTAGAIAVNIVDIGFGLKVREDIYGIGLLLNSHGQHRLGLMTELDETGGNGNKITAYGAGYSYVGQSITLTLDASQRDYENTANNDQLLVTPGIGLRVANTVQLSVNDRILFEDGKKIDEDLWFGVGGGSESWHLAGYSDYVNDLALVFSVFF